MELKSLEPKKWKFPLIVFLQVESVEVSCLGRCGEFHTYSQYPDMGTDVWTAVKVF